MNFYNHVYDTILLLPFECLSNSHSSFCTLISNKQNINIIQQYFTFGIHPEQNDSFHEWCSTKEAILGLEHGKIPDCFIDNSLFSLGIGSKIKFSNDTTKYIKLFYGNDCIYFSKEAMTFSFANIANKEFNIPSTKDEWFNITVLEPRFKLDYQDLSTVLKMHEILPAGVSIELYPDSWVYKKDVDN